MLNKEAIMKHDLKDLKWFAVELGDLLYSPGMTQPCLEENLTILRECYKEQSIDGVFVQYFTRISGALRGSEGYKETGLNLRMPYTKDDFLYSDAPYREIAEQKTVFARGQVTQQLAEIAKKLGVTGFKQLCAQYDRGLEEQVAEGRHLVFPLPPAKIQDSTLTAQATIGRTMGAASRWIPESGTSTSPVSGNRSGCAMNTPAPIPLHR